MVIRDLKDAGAVPVVVLDSSVFYYASPRYREPYSHSICGTALFYDVSTIKTVLFCLLFLDFHILIAYYEKNIL